MKSVIDQISGYHISCILGLLVTKAVLTRLLLGLPGLRRVLLECLWRGCRACVKHCSNFDARVAGLAPSVARIFMPGLPGLHRVSLEF